MKRLCIVLATISLVSLTALAQEGPRDLAGRGEAVDQKQLQQIQQRVAALYISDFKNEVELSDEQFVKVEPLIREFLNRRFRNANDRKALNDKQDKLLSQPNPSQTDFQQVNDQLAQLDSEIGTWEFRFIRRLQNDLADRQLSDRQVALIRAFNRKFFNERLPRVLEAARAAAAANARQRQAARGNQPNRKDPAAQPNRPANSLRGKDNPVPPIRKLAR